MKFSKYGKAGLAIIGVSTAIDAMATGGLGSALISLGLSSGVLESMKGTFGGGLAGLLTHQLVKAGEDFGQGGDSSLQKSFEKALEKALEEVKKDFLDNEEYKITLKQKLVKKLGNGIPSDAAINRGTLERHFFNPLLAAFQEEKTIKEILKTNGQIHPSEMIREIVNSKQIELPEFKKNEQEKLIQVLSEAFNNRFLIHFNNELKANEGAQKAYHTNLLHSLLTQIETVSLNQEASNKSIKKLLRFAKWQKIEIKKFLSQHHDVQETLDKQSKDFQDLKESFEASRELILDVYKERIDNADASGQFKYESLYTYFVGRAEELSFFHNFLEEEKNFAWTMLSGPGGSGKSRLANEICVKAEDLNWVAGFTRLDQNKSFSWENFHFPTDMLIVIDYAQARPEEAQHIIDILCTRFNKHTLSKKVRVILLERHFDQNLTDKLFSGHIKSSETYFGDGQYPIRLNKLEEDARWQIILQTNKGKETEKDIIKNKAEILVQLNKQDPDNRPLFTFFSGVALSEGQSINDWDTHENLAYHLKRQEDKIWSKSPIWKQFSGELRNLIWLASICEYLTFEDLLIIHKETVLIGDFDPNQISDLEYQQLKVLFAANGKSEDPSHMTGIKPDLLAEYYLVTHLVTLQKDERKRGSINQLIDICWKIRPERVWWMAYLTYENFQEHNGHALLLDEIIHLKNTKSTPFFGMLCHNLGFKSHTIDSSESEKYYLLAIENGDAGAMNNLASLYKDQERFDQAEKYYLLAIENGDAGAMYNLPVLYQNQERFDEAEKYYLVVIENGHAGAMYNLALLYQNQERFDEAEKYYQLAIENGVARAMNNLALLYQNQERFDEAEKYYQLAIENGHAGAMYNLAVLYQNQERFDESEKYYLLAIENGFAGAMNNLALLYQNQERFDEAEKYYQLAIENGVASAMNNLAVLYQNQERFDESEKYYPLAIENGDAGAMYNLAVLYQNQERFDEAEKYYQLAIENGVAGAMNNLASLYKDQERFDEAEKYYQLAIENGVAGAMYNLPVLYQNQERFDEAEKYYLLAIENGDAGAMNNLAVLYQNQERFDESEKYYQLAIENGHASALYNLALLYQNQERFDESEKYYQLVIENGNAGAMNNLAVLYQNQERFDEAEKYYLLAIENGFAGAMNNLALLYQNQERFDEAEKYYQLAIENGVAGAMNNLAVLYQNQERFDESEKYYPLAIENGDAGAMYNLAVLYQNQERFDEAEKYYQLAIENGHAGAMNNLASLYKDQERFDQAEKYYLLAIENGDVSAMNNLALLYQNQERFDESEKYYLLAIENGHASALYNLALLYQNQERFDESEKYSLLAIENGDAGAMNNLAVLYQNQERFDESEKYYLLAIENGDASALYNLALLYQNQERFDESEKYYQLAIENGDASAMYTLILLYWRLNKDKRSALDLLKVIKPESSQEVSLQLVCNAWLGKSEYKEHREEVLELIVRESLSFFCAIIGVLLYHDHSDELLIWIKNLPQLEGLKNQMGATYYVLLYFCENGSPELKNVPKEIKEEFEQLVKQVQEKRDFYGRSF